MDINPPPPLTSRRTLGIEAIAFPRYSPDLNPMDYFVWEEVQNRMKASEPKRIETNEAFKNHLRKTALSVPESVIRKGVADMKKRVQGCFDEKGGDIQWD